ncbi:MAG: hypothetical protein Fur007_03110 [Rhodoferax sp.]
MVALFSRWPGRLSVGRKLMMIYLLDLTAVIYVTSLLISEKLDSIDFTRKEVDGTAYVQAVRADLMPLWQRQGAPAQRGVDAPRAQYDAVFRSVDASAQFAAAWSALATGEQDQTESTTLLTREAALVDRAQDLLTTVANQSNLILDPDLDSYYVMSITALRMPEMLRVLQEVRRLAWRAAQSPRERAFEAQVLTLAGRLDGVRRSLESDYGQAQAAGDATLRDKLLPGAQALLTALQSVHADLVSLAAESTGVPSPTLTTHTRDAASALDTAWQLGLAELDRLLRKRVHGLYARMAMHLGTALLLLASILSLVYLVARQIARPLRDLATVAEQVRQTTDYSVRAHWHSSDEIGRLFVAFNDMLAQLDRDRLVQQELAASARAAQAQHELVEALPIAIMVTSVPDHRVLHVNTPARPWVGEATRDPWRQGLEPGVRAQFFQRLSDRDAVDEFEVRWLGGHEPAWAVLSARRLSFQGEDAVLTAFTPINVRKIMEQRLELWAKVFEASFEGIIIMGADRRVVSVNQAFCRSTAYEFYELMGEELNLLIDGPGPDWSVLLEKDAWQGEVRFRRQTGETFPAWLMVSAVRERNGAPAGNYIGIAVDITDRKATEERIRFLAQHDVLTELPNRALCQLRLREAVAHARSAQEQVAVLFIDLDRFKLINDTLGHPVGDGLLRVVAQRLVQAVRAHDTVSRLGGDEFVIIMRHVVGRDELDAIVSQRLIPAIRQPVQVDGHDLSVSCSVGVAMYPEDATDEDELMRRADAAMYEAKSAGRDTARYFSADTDQRALARQIMETHLRGALPNGEFHLHFQPRLCARGRHTLGAEALLRWNNPALGSVPPGEFIQLAEETGLIKGIGHWVLDQACREWVALIHQCGLPGLQLSVNLSAAQLVDEQLVPQVRAVLQNSGLAPGQLELELTESHLMENPSFARQQLSALKDLGVMVAIDDFGTGYSSLAYLKRFEIDRLKIDQSFVRGMLDDSADAAIVQAVIGLGHSLRLTVVAEGVESMATAQALAALGCDELQGYAFARPMPGDDLAQWIAQNPGDPGRRRSDRSPRRT